MIEIVERIKEAYIFETDAEVADFLDLKPSTLSMQKNRGRLNLKRVVDKCSDLNKNWLLDGEGPIRKNDSESDATEIPIYSSFSFRAKNEIDLHNSKKEGEILIDISEEWDYFSLPDYLIGYTILSDAMAPTLEKHDIAFFDLKSRNPNGEAIFLISFNNNVICRRVQENGASYFVSSDNPELDTFEISKNSNDYNIIGEMVGILRNM